MVFANPSHAQKRQMSPALAQALKAALDQQQSGQLDKAIASYQSILQQSPNHSDTNHLLGIAYMQKGEFEPAERHIRQALAANNGNAGYHKNLGLVLLEKKKYEDAAQAFERALSLKPDSLTTIINLGRAYSLTGEEQKSAAFIDKAYDMAPNDLTVILAKADTFLFEGKMDEAKKLYKKCIKDKCYRVAALTRWMQYLHKVKDPKDKYLAMLEEYRSKLESFSPDMRASYHSARAKALDDLGRYDDAMEAMNKSCAEKRALYNYKTREVEKSYLGIKRYFTPEVIERLQKDGLKTKKPTFIIGMPRSGTTLLEQILHSHSKIVGIGESNEFWNLAHSPIDLPEENKTPYPYRVENKNEPLGFKDAAEKHLAFLDAEDPDAERVVNKAITNIAVVPIIKCLYPDAKIIHIRRHPLDNCISGYFKSFNDLAQPYTHDLKTLGEFYKIYRDHMNHFQGIFGDEIFDVQYEDIVEDTEGKARALIEYLELDWEDACLEFYNTEKFVRTASVAQVRKPIYKSSMAKWKRYARHLEPLIVGMGEYAPDDAKAYLKEGSNS